MKEIIEGLRSVCHGAGVEFKHWVKHPTKKGTYVEPTYWCLFCNLPCFVEQIDEELKDIKVKVVSAEEKEQRLPGALIDDTPLPERGKSKYESWLPRGTWWSEEARLLHYEEVSQQ